MVEVLDSIDALEAFVQTNPLAVVDFWAPWCGPCKSIAPFFETLSEDFADIKFGKIDVDAVAGAAAKFSVRGIPALLGFQHGNLVFREAGANPAKLTQAVVELQGPTDTSF